MELEEGIKYLKHEVEVYENNKEINQLIGGKIGETQHEVYKTVLQALDNSIPKEKVKETIKKIEQYGDIVNELIEESIIIADSDSLNFGRKQAHGKDIEELKLLLEE